MIERLTKLTARSETPLYNLKSLDEVPELVVTPVVPRRVQRSADGKRPTRGVANDGPTSDPSEPTDQVLRST